jgi:hypothetical protein
LFLSAAGAGVKTRLQEPQRQSWAISIFFLRVPFRLTWVLPQCGQRSGRLSVSATRLVRVGIGRDALPYHAPTGYGKMDD